MMCYSCTGASGQKLVNKTGKKVMENSKELGRTNVLA